MAGLGRKVFTAGDVLTASDVQNYLMDQTVMNFAGTAARSSAIATPTTGMTTYNQTTQQLESYNGSAYVGMSGLQLVKKQTVGSGVTSVAVTNAFSATYENYKIIYTGGTASANAHIGLSLTGSATGYSSFMVYGEFNTNTVLGAGLSNFSSILYAGSAQINEIAVLNCEVMQPFLAKFTRFSSVATSQTATSTGTTTGIHAVATSYTGCTISVNSGTLTGGTIYVYGYGT